VIIMLPTAPSMCPMCHFKVARGISLGRISHQFSFTLIFSTFCPSRVQNSPLCPRCDARAKEPFPVMRESGAIPSTQLTPPLSTWFHSFRYSHFSPLFKASKCMRMTCLWNFPYRTIRATPIVCGHIVLLVWEF
jgi:hypothetical protein